MSPTSRSSERSSDDRRPASSRRRLHDRAELVLHRADALEQLAGRRRDAMDVLARLLPASVRSCSAVVSAASMMRWTWAEAADATG